MHALQSMNSLACLILAALNSKTNVIFLWYNETDGAFGGGDMIVEETLGVVDAAVEDKTLGLVEMVVVEDRLRGSSSNFLLKSRWLVWAF